LKSPVDKKDNIDLTLDEEEEIVLSDEDRKKAKKERICEHFAKAINTLRVILREEFGMEGVYKKYIALHGDIITQDNAVRLLIRAKLLL
jgi:hypothetical protein